MLFRSNRNYETAKCTHVQNKLDKIERRKKKIGSRHQRKLNKFSNKYNTMFWFFYQINYKGIIDFCGSDIKIIFDVYGPSCKETFRLHEDGHYKNKPIITRHPNILRSVLIGKKGWGLWCNEYSDGIVEWSFTKEEILNEFKIRDIEIPEPFLLEFEKLLHKKKIIRNDNYLNR